MSIEDKQGRGARFLPSTANQWPPVRRIRCPVNSPSIPSPRNTPCFHRAPQQQTVRPTQHSVEANPFVLSTSPRMIPEFEGVAETSTHSYGFPTSVQIYSTPGIPSEHTNDLNLPRGTSEFFETTEDKLKSIHNQFDSNSDIEKLDAIKRLIAVWFYSSCFWTFCSMCVR